MTTALSRREDEIMRHIVAGRITKEIAADFELSVRTVETHRERILIKLRARTMPQAVALWMMGEQLEAHGESQS